MAWLCKDKDGTEWIYDARPFRAASGLPFWAVRGQYIPLPTGSIAKLIGRELTWEDEPYELV